MLPCFAGVMAWEALALRAQPGLEVTKCQRTTESSFPTTASALTVRGGLVWALKHRKRLFSSALMVVGGSWSRSSSRSSSGQRAKRPQLDAALTACKKHKAKLVVAKLDRLSRNVSFLLKLIDSGVEVLPGLYSRTLTAKA